MTEHDQRLIQLHEDRFTGHESRISYLERDMAVTKEFTERVDDDLYNHGQDGLKTAFTKFMAEYRQNKRNREETEKRRQFWMVIGVTLLAVVLAWILTGVLPAAKAVMDDYYDRHPKAMIHKNTSAATPEVVYSNANKLSDSDPSVVVRR